MVERYARFSSAISSINQNIQKIEAYQMKLYGLNGSCAQYLLSILQNDSGLTLSRLGEICQKDKAAVSRTVAQLENKGLVVRKNICDGQYRSKIALTDIGKQAAIELSSVASKAVELAGKGLSQEDRESFYKVLDLISNNLKELSKNGIIK